MKYRFSEIVAIFSFLLIWCSEAYCQTYQDVYNLDFSRVENDYVAKWHNCRYIGIGTLVPHIGASLCEIDGRKCLKLNLPNNDPFLDLGVFSSIVLPERLKGNLVVSLGYKCQNIESAVMTLYAADPESGTVYTDSAELNCDEKFARTSISLDASKIRKLDVRIRAEGKEDRHLLYMPFSYLLFLNNLEIKCGGRLINDVEAVCITEMDMEILNKSLPVELSGKDGFDGMNVLDADVLGIGFGMFEDSSLPVAVAEILKRQIADGGCRAVVAELSVVEGLYLNRYVSGDERFTISMIDKFRNDTVFLNLMKWIKDFNSVREDNVHIWGLNFPVGQQTSNRMYGDSLLNSGVLNSITFLQSVGMSAESPEMDSLISILTDEMRADYDVLYRDGAAYIASNWDKFDDVMGRMDTRMVQYFLAKACNEPRNNFFDDWNPYSKDSLQYVFFRDVVRTLIPESSPIVFLGCLSTLHHSEAVNPWNRSLGCRLREDYGKSYACLGIISDRPRKGEKVYVSPENSLDALCRWAHSPYLYVDCRKLGGLVYVRSDSYFINSGEYFEGVHEFYDLICPKSFMDGMLIVK